MKVFHTIKRHLPAWMIIIISLLVTSCTNQEMVTEPEETMQEELPCVITTDARSFGMNSEEIIRTLRLFIFKEDGTLYKQSSFFRTRDALTTKPTDTYEYFTFVNGDYHIGKLLPKLKFQFVVVANELESLDGTQYNKVGVTTVDDIKRVSVDYQRSYATGDGKLYIQIYDDQYHPDSNLHLIPMYSETKLLTPFEWDATNGVPVNLLLVRALAKVTLQVIKEEGTLIKDLADGETLYIDNASILSVPTSCSLGKTGTAYASATYVNTNIQKFYNNIQITNNSSSKVATDVQTFYIPEHILNKKTAYTHLLISGRVVDGANNTIQTTYTIPLGDGVKSSTKVEDLNLDDLKVSRNTHYDVKAKLTSRGKLEIFELKVKIADWSVENEIDGSVDAPYLNVTSLKVNMSQNEVKVYFWTNQAFPAILEKGSTGGTEFTVNDVFESLAGETNFILTPSDDANYKAYNGYFILKFKEEFLYIQNETYILTLQAGALKREITVVANPVVAQIKLDLNDGTGTVNTHGVRYADLADKTIIFGSTIALADPATPPEGKKLLLWVYTDDQRQVDVDADGRLQVELKGYTTSIKAIWTDK